MTLLLSSFVCDFCDGHLEVVAPYRGFVVWSADHPIQQNAFVFATREDADTWTRATNKDDADIREVRMEEEPSWHKGRGSVQGITLADRVYEVYPDHRFEPASNRAFLA
jgi:hypothetical protein